MEKIEYQPVIGLEVHLHLDTETKAFCGCSTEFGNQPNTQVCPVCLGFPGSLPVLNRIALEYGIKVGLALNCRIPEYTKFDRKNYFYPDLPKNYQISQYDLPLAVGGILEITCQGNTKKVNILRVHLEEDAGKLIHRQDASLVDFNRAGIPLLEIVSQPELYSPQEAYEYLTALKSIIEYLGVSDCDMEKGSLRCDANVSVRPVGFKGLGTKAEVKNMNSFKAVKDALSYEISRQIEILENGEKVVQETRLWEAKEMKTFSMRSKEEAKDYRYFPEPDLPPFIINKESIERIQATIPELPRDKMARFIKDYGVSEYDAKILVSSKDDALYAERCMNSYQRPDKKPVVNLLIGPLLAQANNRNSTISSLNVPLEDLIVLLGYLDSQSISHLVAKSVLEEMIQTGKTPETVIREKNLIQISEPNQLDSVIEEVLREHAKSAQDYKNGKNNALMFLVGQVMKKTSGKANPKVVQDVLKRRLTDA